MRSTQPRTVVWKVVGVVAALVVGVLGMGVLVRLSCSADGGGGGEGGGNGVGDRVSGSGGGASVPEDVRTIPPIGEARFPTVTPGEELRRYGDEIMVAGRMFRTGTRVVLWTDPRGYDAYRTERRFSPWTTAEWAPPVLTPTPRGPVLAFPSGYEDQPRNPARTGLRDEVLSWAELEQVRGGAWPLELLRQKVDQFVMHYDVVGASKFCFKTLHDERGLSIHFLLDIDGTIYQTMDLKDRAFHATTSNHRSIGIEIANRGAYESDVPLREFYARDADGPFVSFPARFGDGGLLVPGKYRPARPELVRGTINGLNLVMYDLTPQQYDALARLTAAVCTALPKVTLDYPKDSRGRAILRKLPDGDLARLQGLVGHYHIQDEKYDPGPAFDWERVVVQARGLMSAEALAANRAEAGRPVRPGTLAGVQRASTSQPSTRPGQLLRDNARPAPRNTTPPARNTTPPRTAQPSRPR